MDKRESFVDIMRDWFHSTDRDKWIDEYAARESAWEAEPDYDALIGYEDSGMLDIGTDEGGWGAWMEGEE